MGRHPVLVYNSFLIVTMICVEGTQETTVHDGQNSRWQLRMRRLALNTQDVPRRADLGYFVAQPAWRTFFSRLCAERVGFACSIWQEEDAKMAVLVWPPLDLIIRLALAEASFVSGVLKLTHWTTFLTLILGSRQKMRPGL